MIGLRKRDLKARLSEHLERVARGEVITGTSRGRRVVCIVAVLGRDNLDRGLAEGWITRRVDRAPEPVLAAGRAEAVVASILAGGQPLVLAGAGWVLFGERLSGRALVGWPSP